jgi:hypothetical protein
MRRVVSGEEYAGDTVRGSENQRSRRRAEFGQLMLRIT